MGLNFVEEELFLKNSTETEMFSPSHTKTAKKNYYNTKGRTTLAAWNNNYNSINTRRTAVATPGEHQHQENNNGNIINITNTSSASKTRKSPDTHNTKTSSSKNSTSSVTGTDNILVGAIQERKVLYF